MSLELRNVVLTVDINLRVVSTQILFKATELDKITKERNFYRE